MQNWLTRPRCRHVFPLPHGLKWSRRAECAVKNMVRRMRYAETWGKHLQAEGRTLGGTVYPGALPLRRGGVRLRLRLQLSGMPGQASKTAGGAGGRPGTGRVPYAGAGRGAVSCRPGKAAEGIHPGAICLSAPALHSARAGGIARRAADGEWDFRFSGWLAARRPVGQKRAGRGRAAEIRAEIQRPAAGMQLPGAGSGTAGLPAEAGQRVFRRRGSASGAVGTVRAGRHRRRRSAGAEHRASAGRAVRSAIWGHRPKKRRGAGQQDRTAHPRRGRHPSGRPAAEERQQPPRRPPARGHGRASEPAAPV